MESILRNITILLDVISDKINNDDSLSFLKRELAVVRYNVTHAEKDTYLNLHAEGMARQVYDNFWDTKDIYYDFVRLNKLQNRFNITVDDVIKSETSRRI